MAVRKPFSSRRLALNISRVCESIEKRAKADELTVEDSLRYLSTMAQLTPGFTKLLESADLEKRVRSLERELKRERSGASLEPKP